MTEDVRPGPDRMSEVEALMWNLEADPHLSSTFANLTVFDRPPDHDRLRHRLWRASRLVPRLRRRVEPGVGPLTPAWTEDLDFDLDRHLRRVTLPAGSTIADAHALAAELVGRPFDRDRPLWEFTVIDGLPDGRAAMVQKMHHSITDGEGGIRMSVEFIDLERDAPEPPPVDDGPPPPPPPAPRSLVGSALDSMGEVGRRSADSARRLVDQATGLVRDPAALATLLAGLPSEGTATAKSIIRQLGADERRSPLWVERSLDRRLDTFQVPLDDVKEAAHRLGGSVNDLFVAAACGGSGAYHRARGYEIDELRMAMPISTRSKGDTAGNSFTPTRVLVPTQRDPRTRFAEVHERLTETKGEKAVGLASSLAGLVNLLPQPLIIRVARQQVTTVDFTTSNVRAAPFDLYIAGSLVQGNYPLGPLAGTAWNLTTMSYRGLLDLGLHTDTAAVAEPEALAADIADAFTELIELDRPRPRTRTTAKAKSSAKQTAPNKPGTAGR